MVRTTVNPRFLSGFLERNLDIIGLMLAVTITFFPVLQGQIILVRDTAHWSLPLRWRLRESFLRGELPGWDPTQGIGFPLLADPLVGAFYPPNFLYLLPNTGLMVTLDPLLHLCWGGLGIVAILRFYELQPVARLIGGIGWSISGLSIGLWTTGVVLQSAAWLPWAAYSGACLARQTKASAKPRDMLRTMAFCSLPTAMGFLQGELFLTIMGIGLMFLTGMLTLWQRDGSTDQGTQHTNTFLRYLGRCIVSTVAATLIGAANLVVVAKALGSTLRNTSLPRAIAEDWSFHPLRFVEIIAPGAMGIPIIDHAGARYIGDNQNEFWATTVYLGATTLALAWIAIDPRNPRRRLAWGCAAVSVGALLIALGKHLPVHGLFRLIPPFGQMRYPEKYLVVLLVMFAVLVGIGAHTVISEKKLRWRFACIVPVILVVLILANGKFPLSLRRYVLSGSIHGLVASVLLLGIVILKPVRNRFATLLLPLLVTVDLVIPATGSLFFVPNELASRRPPIVDVIQKRRRISHATMPIRVYPDPLATGAVLANFKPSFFAELESLYLLLLIPNTGIRYGIANIRGYDAAIPRNWTLISEAGPARDWVRFAASEFAIGYAGSWASRAGYQSAGFDSLPGFRLFDIGDSLPRAYVVGKTIPFQTKNPAEVLNESVLSGHLAMVQPDDHESALRLNTTATGRCNIDAYEDNHLSATCDTDGESLAVFVEQHASGWTALLDGQPTTIHRVNRVMRGVRMKAGLHRIEMTYRVPGLTTGLLVSTLGVLLIVAMLYMARSRAQPPA